MIVTVSKKWNEDNTDISLPEKAMSGPVPRFLGIIKSNVHSHWTLLLIKKVEWTSKKAYSEKTHLHMISTTKDLS